MNKCLRLNYQRQLIYAGLDDFNPNNVFPTYMGGQDGAEEWRKAVVTYLYQGVTYGLLAALNWGNLFSPEEPIDIEGFLSKNYAYDKYHIESDVVWNALYFFGTKNLIDDLNRFGLRSWDAMRLEEDTEFLRYVQNKYKLDFGF